MSFFVNNDVASGARIYASDHNEQGSRLAAVLNGGVDNNNINSSAAIDGSKLADASITNAKLATGANQPGGAWTTWTPTWTNLTLGSGTVTALYKQVGKTVHFNLRFVMGAGSAVGTAPNFTLPLTASSTTYDNTKNNIIGQSWAEDVGVANFAGVVAMQGSLTTAAPLAYNQSVSATYITQSSYTASVPFSFGSGDYFVCAGTYEAA